MHATQRRHQLPAHGTQSATALHDHPGLMCMQNVWPIPLTVCCAWLHALHAVGYQEEAWNRRGPTCWPQREGPWATCPCLLARIPLRHRIPGCGTAFCPVPQACLWGSAANRGTSKRWSPICVGQRLSMFAVCNGMIGRMWDHKSSDQYACACVVQAGRAGSSDSACSGGCSIAAGSAQATTAVHSHEYASRLPWTTKSPTSTWSKKPLSLRRGQRHASQLCHDAKTLGVDPRSRVVKQNHQAWYHIRAEFQHKRCRQRTTGGLCAGHCYECRPVSPPLTWLATPGPGTSSLCTSIQTVAAWHSVHIAAWPRLYLEVLIQPSAGWGVHADGLDPLELKVQPFCGA